MNKCYYLKPETRAGIGTFGLGSWSHAYPFFSLLIPTFPPSTLDSQPISTPVAPNPKPQNPLQYNPTSP